MQKEQQNDEKRYVKVGGFGGFLEEVGCAVCADKTHRKKIYSTSFGVNIYLCNKCELMYASPRFTEESLLQIYESEDFGDYSYYDGFTYEGWKKARDSSYVVSSLKVDLVKKYVKNEARVLDIGCATGLFVLEATRNNLRAEGIDPSAMLIEAGKKSHDCKIARMPYEEFNPPYRFDAVVIWDVLEHVYDPLGLMNKAYDLLEPGGYVFIQVPNYRGISTRVKSLLTRAGLKRSDYKHFGFPYHIFSFDRNSLEVIFNKAGFDVVLFESWSQKMKNGVQNFITDFIRRRAISDYIICVGKKRQDKA